jgi:hypothetical protein
LLASILAEGDVVRGFVLSAWGEVGRKGSEPWKRGESLRTLKDDGVISAVGE